MVAIRVGTPDDKDALENFVRNLVKELGEEFDLKRFEWGLARRLYDPLQRHGIFIAEEDDTKKPV